MVTKDIQMTINWSLDIWNLIVAIIFLGGIWGKLSAMETKVNAMWHHFLADRRYNPEVIE